MEKVLEDYLWNEITIYSGDGCEILIVRRMPRDVINEMLERGWIKSPKQAWGTLNKWIRKGRYDYGCSLDCGWGIDK